MIFSLAKTDPALLAQMTNFNSLIGSGATGYGLTSAQATQLGTLFTAFQTALAACGKAVRNETAVVTKNAARTALKSDAYNLAMIVAGVSTVTDAQKLALGIKPRATPMPKPTPTVSPTLKVASVSGTSVAMSVHDVSHGKRGGLPAGVVGTNVFTYVGATPPASTSAWKFEGGIGRGTATIEFDPSLAPGTTVWITAFYFNSRKESGPASPPISANLPGGSALPPGVEMKLAA